MSKAIEAGSKIFHFCENVLLGMSHTQAAKAAGYSSTHGSRLMKKPEVKTYLETQRYAMRRAAIVTREDAIQGFLHAIQDAKLLSDPNAQIAGWREVARMLGFYEPEKKELKLSLSQEETRKQLEALPEDELLKLVGDVEDAQFDFIPAPEPKNGSKTESKH